MNDTAGLPPHIDCNGEWHVVCARLYAQFCAIFKPQQRIRIMGKTLIFDQRMIDSEFEEAFWHLITRGDPDRLLDTERARRLCWIPSMIDGTAPGFTRWVTTEGNGKNKLYYWLEAERYVLIIKEQPRIMFLNTAFYVDKPWLETDLRKRRASGAAF